MAPKVATREQGVAVEAAREHILAGDIFQVVLAQRFDVELEAEPFDVYRVLRQVNPSPYMYFFRYDALTVVLSHWTADLLIYNWPRLASGRWETVVPSILVVLVPLLPVAAWLIWGRRSVARPVASG